jgi:group I intron endonuclease
VNNKAYIGITSKSPEERWGTNGRHYREKQSVFYKAIKKYGWDGFEHIIFMDNISEQKAKHIERLLIGLYRTNCTKYKSPEMGYNMTDGGDGVVGTVYSQEARQKLSYLASHRSEETRKKISVAAKERFSNPENHPMYGRTHTEETRLQMSDKARQRLSIPENNPFYGKQHTEESKKKIGDGHRNPSDDTRKKMSDSAKARCTEEWKQKMARIASEKKSGQDNPNAKCVYQYSEDWMLLKIWKTVKSVADEYNISVSTVSGTWLKKPNNLYRGYHWSLVNNDIHSEVV